MLKLFLKIYFITINQLKTLIATEILQILKCFENNMICYENYSKLRKSLSFKKIYSF